MRWNCRCAVHGGLGFGAFAEIEIFFDEKNFVGHAAQEKAQMSSGAKGHVIVGASFIACTAFRPSRDRSDRDFQAR